MPAVIEAVMAWYERFGQGKGRTRLGTFLLDRETWKRFLADLAPVLGEWAVPDPPPPAPNEIHFQQSQA